MIWNSMVCWYFKSSNSSIRSLQLPVNYKSRFLKKKKSFYWAVESTPSHLIPTLITINRRLVWYLWPQMCRVWFINRFMQKQEEESCRPHQHSHEKCFTVAQIKKEISDMSRTIQINAQYDITLYCITFPIITYTLFMYLCMVKVL